MKNTEQQTSEILGQEYLEGERTSVGDLFGCKMNVRDYRIMDSKFKGKFAIVQTGDNDSKLITFIVNSVMLNQLKGVKKEHFPIKLTIAKNVKGFLTFRRVV